MNDEYKVKVLKEMLAGLTDNQFYLCRLKGDDTHSINLDEDVIRFLIRYYSKPKAENMRSVISMIEVDDSRAVDEELGTIEYLEREFGWLEGSGIYLTDARILDEDDTQDKEGFELAEKMFF